MDGVKFQAERGHRLGPPGHPRGVSCGAQGPSPGPIKLLVKTAKGFEPRPVARLNALLERIFARPIDCAGLMGGLRAKLEGKTFEERRQEGLDVMRDIGIVE